MHGLFRALNFGNSSRTRKGVTRTKVRDDSPTNWRREPLKSLGNDPATVCTALITRLSESVFVHAHWRPGTQTKCYSTMRFLLKAVKQSCHFVPLADCLVPTHRVPVCSRPITPRRFCQWKLTRHVMRTRNADGEMCLKAHTLIPTVPRSTGFVQVRWKTFKWLLITHKSLLSLTTYILNERPKITNVSRI
jgi:hypothetical protein